MLKKEKELFIEFIGNPNILNGVFILFTLFLFGVFYSYYSIETKIDAKNLVDVYAKNPKIENYGVGQPTCLTFECATQKEITFRLESQYIESYDKSYLFSFDMKDKLYKLKVLKTDLTNARNGDILNLYSILDENPIVEEKRFYLTIEEYKNAKKMHNLRSFKACILFASIFFVWIVFLIFKKVQL